MRVRVLWFGRPTRSPFEQQIADYQKRVNHRWPAEDVALKPVARQRSDNPRAALAKEARSVLDHHPAGWTLVTLDERARLRRSQDLAKLLAEQERTRPGITLVIGSDLGLDRELKQSADLELSLGQLTLPHLLARLVLWEQLYRATDILGHGKYHRPGV